MADTSAATAGGPDSAMATTPSAPAVSTATAETPPAPTGAVTAQRAAEHSDVPPEDLLPVVAPRLSQVDTTITLRAHGPELAFDPETITLKQGTRVRIRLQNMGTFAHNFILARTEEDMEELAARAVDARENVPMSLRSKMLVWTNIAQPSQTVEAGFVVPPPGEYFYVCLVEGHANVMVGTLRSLP